MPYKKRLSRSGITNYRRGFNSTSFVAKKIDDEAPAEPKQSDSMVTATEAVVGGSITPNLQKKLNNATQATKKLNKFIKFDI